VAQLQRMFQPNPDKQLQNYQRLQKEHPVVVPLA
jgi:hypothetical protein